MTDVVADVDLSAADAATLVGAALALARSFAGGATLWCVAPEWRAHGRHVAVEFVHPVIVGTRALPAVSVEDPDLVAALRPVVRPGDVLLGVASSACAELAPLLRRAEAWGATTLWIGCGPRPSDAAADHVLWVGGETSDAAFDGRIVLRYHVLWELTHVCFEHPGLLAAPASMTTSTAGDDEVCITCSDEGRLAEVVATGPDDGAGRTADVEVRTARGIERIDATLVAPVRAGDLLLVHAGVALTLVDEAGP